MTRGTAAWLVAGLLAAGTAHSREDAPPQPLSIVPVQQDAPWAVKWWMPRHEQKLAEAREHAPFELVFLGDSITHGFENGGKAQWDRHFAPKGALNLGFSGDRTEHVLWRIRHGALDNLGAPRAAVVMIGTNNTGHRMDPAEDTAAGVGAILDELKARLPQTKVLLLGIFPRAREAGKPQRVRNEEINALIARFADGKRVFYQDLAPAFLEADGTLPKATFPDALHPNAEGYRIWVETMKPALDQVLERTKG